MISALPEPLLHRIISFLPYKDAVRTSILSKTWEKACCTFPVLEFDEDLFERDLREMKSARRDVKKCNQIKGKLLNYWRQALQTRYQKMFSLEKLTLKASLLSDSEFADRCFRYASERNVKELKLEISLPRPLLYNLPQMVLCSESLNVLELQGCKLELPRSSNVKSSSLRRLILLFVHAEDSVVENLVAGCPLVEYLNIEFCEGLKSLKLIGHSKLSQIDFKGVRELEEMNVNALNARLISVQGPVASSKIDVGSCKNLKFLYLCSTSVVDECLSCQISRHPLLEGLGLDCCDELQNIEISSPFLKSLDIFRCMNLSAVKIETPNLSEFDYDVGVIHFSLGALPLLEANLYFYTRNIDIQWYVQFTELIAKFHQLSKALNLGSNTGECVIVPKELRQIRPPSLSGVKHLNFSISSLQDSFPIAQVVDGLLWMSPHVDTISIDYGDHFKKFCFQIFYKDKVVNGGIQCCKPVPVLCWGNCIKRIEVEMISKEMEFNMTYTDYWVLSETKRFVFEDEDILKKIDGLGDLILDNRKFRWMFED